MGALRDAQQEFLLQMRKQFRVGDDALDLFEGLLQVCKIADGHIERGQPHHIRLDDRA